MTHATSRLANPARPPVRAPSRAPSIIRAPNAVVRGLMRIGLPMGPNTLLTVRGRASGAPRTAPVAVMEVDGHRYVIGAYGDVNWVRNLRAAGEGLLRLRGREVPIAAHELSRAEASTFFRTTLPGYIGRFPWFGRAFARLLFGLVGPEVLDDPETAAETRPVFELILRPA
jgi:deazaflavin-dependent oxidoreductase (nitroreductase family)